LVREILIWNDQNITSDLALAARLAVGTVQLRGMGIDAPVFTARLVTEQHGVQRHPPVNQGDAFQHIGTQ
jgi:hypothetical protein